MLTLIPLSSISLGLSSYFASPALGLNASFVARHRRVVLASAALLTLANLPFTAAFILPRVYRLKKIEKAVLKGAYNSGSSRTGSTLTCESRGWRDRRRGRVDGRQCAEPFVLASTSSS